MKHNVATVAFSFIALIGFLACSKTDHALDSVNQTPGKLNDLNQKIDHANEQARQQALFIAKTDMEKPENTQNLSSPLDMFPAAKAFADAANASDLISLTYLNLKDIEEVKIDDRLRVNGIFPTSVLDASNHAKQVKLMEIRLVAAFASQAVVQDLVSQQIDHGGPYENAAYAFLAARATFVSQVFLDAGVVADGLSNPGQYRTAAGYLKSLEYLAALPFVERCVLRTTGFVDASGRSDPALNASDRIDVVRIRQQTSEVKEKFKADAANLSPQSDVRALAKQIESL